MNLFRRIFKPPESANNWSNIWKSWLVSPNGQKVVTALAALTGTACFSSYLFPHVFFISKTESILRMYKDGDPVELPKQLRHRTQQVLEDTTLSQKDKNQVSFFTAFGFDVLHAGASKLRNGAIVGIPISFNYRSTSDIDQNQLALLDHPDFSWGSRMGQRILTTLFMSNRAQQFAIAREIYYTNTYYVYLNGMAAASSFMTSYLAGRFVNRRLNLYKRPLGHRLGLYAILGFLGGVTFLLMKDMITTSLEMWSDEKAADIGKDYVLGGLEYYECLIERNKALREAMGENGDKYYTAGGNVKEWIRVSQVPLTSRFDYMKKRLEDHEMTEVFKPTKRDGIGKSPVTSVDALSKDHATEEKKIDYKKLKL